MNSLCQLLLNWILYLIQKKQFLIAEIHIYYFMQNLQNLQEIVY